MNLIENPKQMAILKGVRLGMNDRDAVALRFTMFIEPLVCADGSLFGQDILDFIWIYHVRDISELNGKAVYVEVRDGLIIYKEPCVI